ncbi:DUF397 domain-containing protein [Nocardiopsis ganjiahuensis]|uniref:DUF397 domain-containing protein n=1 Tax=Nocardiopsis ganjiahuensis TaxID=239984 RepID=UPI0003495DC7|nr:DUF397 domain-containing protein [Nocardiopsis ganjiahuensis]
MTNPQNGLRPTLAEITRRPFVKSSFSGGQGSCVGIKRFGNWTVVGKHELGDASPVLVFPSTDWDEFCIRVSRGEESSAGEVAAVFTPDGGFTLTEATNDRAPIIVYDKAEWDAFALGARAGELRGANTRGTLVS